MINLGIFKSSPEHKSCWEYNFVLITPLPTNDQNAIKFNKETGEATIKTNKNNSKGIYKLRIEGVDKETKHVKRKNTYKRIETWNFTKTKNIRIRLGRIQLLCISQPSLAS